MGASSKMGSIRPPEGGMWCGLYESLIFKMVLRNNDYLSPNTKFAKATRSLSEEGEEK